jgi:hypothetical protein
MAAQSLRRSIHEIMQHRHHHHRIMSISSTAKRSVVTHNNINNRTYSNIKIQRMNKAQFQAQCACTSSSSCYSTSCHHPQQQGKGHGNGNGNNNDDPPIDLNHDASTTFDTPHSVSNISSQDLNLAMQAAAEQDTNTPSHMNTPSSSSSSQYRQHTRNEQRNIPKISHNLHLRGVQHPIREKIHRTSLQPRSCHGALSIL